LGKGRIISNLGKGKYKVELEYATSRALSVIDQLEKKIEELQDKVSTSDEELSELEDEYKKANEKLIQAIEDLKSLKPGTEEYQKQMEEVEKKTEKYNEALDKHKKARLQKSGLEFEIKSAEKRIETINKNLERTKTVEVWCVDYSTDLSGTVGTIEIPGVVERVVSRPRTSSQVYIRPGFDDGAEYKGERDGKLSSVFNMTPAQTYYNYAMQPGWQKWKPMYRVAEVDSVDSDNNTADIALDREWTIIEKNANHKVWLYDVPIDYMDCGPSLFKHGDRVVVKFEDQSWDNPKVVGFVEKPKRCACCWIIAREITHEENNPIWDLDPYRYEGLKLENSRWRVLEWDWPQFHDIAGDVDKDSGELLGLPTRFESNFSYYGYMALIVCTDGLDPLNDAHANMEWDQDSRYCPEEDQE